LGGGGGGEGETLHKTWQNTEDGYVQPMNRLYSQGWVEKKAGKRRMEERGGLR